VSGLRLKGKKLTCQDEHDEGHNGTPLPDPARVLRLLVRHLRCFPCVCRARTGEAPRLVSRRQSAKGAAQCWGLGVKCVVNRQRRASSAVGGGGLFFFFTQRAAQRRTVRAGWESGDGSGSLMMKCCLPPPPPSRTKGTLFFSFRPSEQACGRAGERVRSCGETIGSEMQEKATAAGAAAERRLGSSMVRDTACEC